MVTLMLVRGYLARSTSSGDKATHTQEVPLKRYAVTANHAEEVLPKRYAGYATHTQGLPPARYFKTGHKDQSFRGI